MGCLAADMRSSQAKVLAKIMDKQRARLNGGGHRLAVDRHADVGERHVGAFQDLARAKARVSARAVMTPAILPRYSAEPRPSAEGSAIAVAAAAARARAGLSSAVPTTDAAASRANSAVPATLVRPMAQVAIVPPETIRITAAAAVA